ncbi:putative glutamine--tRNA ligase [Nosema granulosis]|uniref:glutamine--tRNA ligase n=1 Tax=Nosema granulosis TaxID=83296 RepID=A0A9P6H0Z8_9MICR|nr:putative glutamine--tRNA ligase [Nosema granulosis]
MSDLIKILEKLNIEESKLDEINKKPQLKNNLEIVFSKFEPDNKLFYVLACTASKKIDLLFVGDLISKNFIQNEGELKGIYKYLEKNKNVSKEETIQYIKDNRKTDKEIIEIINSLIAERKSKKDILFELKNILPLADFKFVMAELNNKKYLGEFVEGSDKKKRDWLDEGEIAKLHRPGENPQINEEIRKHHLERTGGRVVTRFPPEPNGILHIGHAKAINLNFSYAEKHGGYTYLRFDDTNPKNEEDFYFESILEDVKWLGFTPYKVTASSNYFEKMIEFAVKLINKDKAYICELSVEEIKGRRREFSKALEDCEKGREEEIALILSPFRNRPKEENLKIFKEMVAKKHKEGTYTLRFKMNLDSKNPLMFDLVGMRIIDEEHVKTGSKYNLYPSYEFALCVSDSLEDVTHSFCTREFFTRQESYNWLLDELEIYKPVQWEFSRLNISNTVLSKRKLVPLSKFGINLDDPRLYTIRGMRRRGIPAEAINNFVRNIGITYADTVIDMKLFESFIREELNRTARRIMCVINPLRIFIRNAKPKTISAPDLLHDSKVREIDFTKEIFIENSDFSYEGGEDFFRFTPNQTVGLYLVGAIKFIEMKDGIITADLVDETPKKYIHWVSSDSKKVELRIYSDLFRSFNPNAVDYLSDLNIDSLVVKEGFCDKRIEGCKPEDKFQFQRLGYFCVDKDSSSEKIILNKTIALK